MEIQAQIRELILELTAARGPTKTICPSEVARAIKVEDWRVLMREVRAVAQQLCSEGLVDCTQRGEIVNAQIARGPIRLRAKDV